MSYFFTADTHFWHENIMKYCQRPFQTVEEMNETIIANWNRVVGEQDMVYHLGDFGFWKGGDLKEIFQRLRGRKFLIRGNHDPKGTQKLDWEWVKDVAMIQIEKQYIWLSHYAHRSWNRSFHGSWHLFGHTHGKLGGYGFSIDVGVDSWNFTPVSIEQVKSKMEKIEKQIRLNQSCYLAASYNDPFV